jgi:UrcA family protein
MKTAIIAALTVIAFAGTAEAGSVSVDVSARDLTTTEGAAKVYAVLQKRAERACAPSHVSLAATKRAKACRADLMGAFVAQLDAPSITALHTEGRSRRFAEAR